MRIRCCRCGEPASSEVPDGTIVRAWVECPECVEKYDKEEKKMGKPMERSKAHHALKCVVLALDEIRGRNAVDPISRKDLVERAVKHGAQLKITSEDIIQVLFTEPDALLTDVE